MTKKLKNTIQSLKKWEETHNYQDGQRQKLKRWAETQNNKDGQRQKLKRWAETQNKKDEKRRASLAWLTVRTVQYLGWSWSRPRSPFSPAE